MFQTAGVSATTRRSRSSTQTGKFLLRAEHDLYRRHRRMQIATEHRDPARYAPHLSGIGAARSNYSDFVESGRKSLPVSGPARARYSRAASAFSLAAGGCPRTPGPAFLSG